MGYSGGVERSPRWRAAGRIGPWLLFAALLYAPFLGHPFQYDDDHAIVGNAALGQPGAWKAALAGTLPSSGEVPSSHYRPLTYLSYLLILRLAGLAPTAFHGLSLALHLISAWLVVVLVRDLVHDRRVGVFAGALFALHPLASEAVLYASARATLLATTFSLAALVSYVRARQAPGAGRPAAAWWTAWAASGVCALLSKETSIVLPLLCLTADRLVLSDRKAVSTAWGHWGPHAAAFGTLLLFSIWLELERFVTAALVAPDAVSRYLTTVVGQVGAIGMMLRLFAFPWPLTVDHPLPIWPELGAVLLGSLAVSWFLLGFIAFASENPERRPAGFFAIWVIIVALPTTLWPLNVPFQEHRAYWSLAGLAALAAMGLVRLLDAGLVDRRLAAVAGTAAVLTGGTLVIQQGRTWSDPIRLWDHARAIAPDSFRAQTNAGLALAAAGRWDEADAAMTSALALNPDYPPALVARGVMEQRRGRQEAARVEYERAAALRADYVPALYNLGLIAQELNDPVTAERWYRRALAVNPLHADGLLNLGVLLLAQQRFQEADAIFARARAASPRTAEVSYYSGVLAERRGLAAVAQGYYREAWGIAAASGREALAADAQARLTALGAGHGGTP